MDSTVISAVVGALAVVLGTWLAHWLDRRANREERRAEIQGQLLFDLRQALVAVLNTASTLVYNATPSNGGELEFDSRLHQEYIGATSHADSLLSFVDDQETRSLALQALSKIHDLSSVEHSDDIEQLLAQALDAFGAAHIRIGQTYREQS